MGDVTHLRWTLPGLGTPKVKIQVIDLEVDRKTPGAGKERGAPSIRPGRGGLGAPQKI